MKYITKPPTVLIAKKEVAADIPTSDISVARLIDDGLLVLYREMTNLKMLSVHGKLDAASARDLRDTIKLLFELKERENESLHGMTDEQIAEALKDVKD